MYKRIMVFFVTGLLLTQVTGCGDKNAPETAEMNVTVEEIVEVDKEKVSSASVPSDSEDPAETAPDAEFDEPAVFEEADLTCILPDGFNEHDVEGLYVHKNYPTDTATIDYMIVESDEDIMEMAKEEYKEMLEVEFLDRYGDDIEVVINSFEKIRVDGRNGLKVKMEYEFRGTVYEQLIYLIKNGDENHNLSFTQEKDGGWMDEFEKSGDTISFEAK